MLFLSVVLMLPASAISVSKKNYNSAPAVLLLITGDWLSSFFISAAYYFALAVIIYLSYAYYKSIGRPPVNDKYPANFVYKKSPNYTFKKEITLGLEKHYYLRVGDSARNKACVEECLSYSSLLKQGTGNEFTGRGDSAARIYYGDYIGKYLDGVEGTKWEDALYITVVPKCETSFNSCGVYELRGLLNFILLIAHEFIDFYFRMLEPTIFYEYESYRAFVEPARKFVGLTKNNEPERLPAC